MISGKTLALIIKNHDLWVRWGTPHTLDALICVYIKKSSFIQENLQHKILGVYLVQGKLVYVWFKASTGKYSTSTEHVLLMGHLINEPTHIKYVLKKKIMQLITCKSSI